MVAPGSPSPKARSLVTFISDFGLADEWVGVCRAVMLQRVPGLSVVDICHQVPAFDIRRGAFLLAASIPPLEPCIHMAVVDPGVGGARRALCVETPSGHIFVGPDNGLLMPAITRAGGVEAAYSINQLKIPGGPAASPPSPTFQGRDLFAPAVAALALGHAPSEFATIIDPEGLIPSPWREAQVDGHSATGEVIEIDAFGSIHLSVDRRSSVGQVLALALGHKVEVSTSKGGALARAVSTYSDAEEEEPICLWDSTGYLTVAVNKGDAAKVLSVKVGDEMRVRILSR